MANTAHRCRFYLKKIPALGAAPYLARKLQNQSIPEQLLSPALRICYRHGLTDLGLAAAFVSTPDKAAFWTARELSYRALPINRQSIYSGQ